MDGIASEKVNINVGGGEGGGGAMAALVAALGNRNQGGDTAALIAAMGNRDHHDGMNNLWPILLLALLGKRGGFGGGDDDCGPPSPAQAAILQTLMEGQSDLRAQVPTVGLETQNAVLGAIAQLALGTQQAISQAKDVTQNGFTLTGRDIAAVNQNVSEQGCQTRETVLAAESRILSRLDRNEIDSLRHDRDRAERQLEVNALRSQVEVNQTVNTNQQQAQAQWQVNDRFNDLVRRFDSVANQIQRVRADSDIVNFGTMAASGNQATTSTQVR